MENVSWNLKLFSHAHTYTASQTRLINTLGQINKTSLNYIESVKLQEEPEVPGLEVLRE